MSRQAGILGVIAGVLVFGSVGWAGPQVLEVSPTYLGFGASEGGANPAAQVVSIWNSGHANMDWTVTPDCNWIAVEPNSGTSSGEVDDANIIVDINGLTRGTYNCQLTVTGSGAPNSPQIVTVLLLLDAGDILMVPSEYSTIQAAIDAAVAGDVVIIEPGTYTGAGNRDLDFGGKAITVRSINPADPCVVAATVIDCNGSESYPRRGFHFQNAEGPNSIVSGLKIINGYGSVGGGIFTDYASPTITRCVIEDNQAPHGQGGGICCRGGTPVISNCIMSNNSTAPYGKGGGIYSWRSSPEIRNCLIIDNASNGYGGGIYCDGKTPFINLCTIVGNSALYMGGGICASGTDSASGVENSIIWGNTAPAGPGIKLRNTSYPTVSYSDVQGGFSGQGNFNSDPCFSDPTGGNYHLLADSPCINSGDPCYVPSPNEKDIDGEDRVIAGRVDVGIDEVNIDGPVIGVTPRNLDFSADEGGPNPEPQLLYISNSNMGSGTMNWEINEDCSWLSAIPNSGTSSGEVNEVTVTVDISEANQGLHECELVVTSSEANNSPQIVYVSLYVYGNLPVPSIYPTVQSAIDASLNGDTVLVADGVYTGSGNRDIDFLGKAITVKSENGPENCIIDCAAAFWDNHRGFYFNNGEDRDSVLEGFTITNAYVTVMCEAGAGIYIGGASPTISKCIITDNHARLEPGSLCYCLGGGIYIGPGGNPLITDCVIRENSAEGWGWGGGIYCDSSQMTINNCLISNNTAQGVDSSGGGIYCDSSSILTVVNCTIVDNLASQEGGGIYFFTYNSPTRTITNSIIWSNSPDQINAYDNTNILTDYSDVQDGFPGTGNIDADPLFANSANGDYHLKSTAGRWDPNSESWVIDGNTSPCIDAGNPGCPLGDEPADANNVRINMGAYGGTAEAGKTPADWRSIADLTNDWVVDLSDLAVFVEFWLAGGECIPSDLSRNGSVGFVDFSILADEWGW